MEAFPVFALNREPGICHHLYSLPQSLSSDAVYTDRYANQYCNYHHHYYNSWNTVLSWTSALRTFSGKIKSMYEWQYPELNFMQNVKKFNKKSTVFFSGLGCCLSLLLTISFQCMTEIKRKKGFHLYPSDLLMFKCLFWITNPACRVHEKYVLLTNFAEKEGLQVVYFASNNN